MKFLPTLREVRAAHALSVAMFDGVDPDPRDLKALGLPNSMSKRFKR